MREQHRDREDRGRRVGLALAGDVGRAAVDRLEHRRVLAAGVDVAGRGQADAAGDRRGDVGDDVAEEVVGDDDVEAARVGRHEDRRGVDVLVGHLDVRELRTHGLDGAPPQVPGVDEHVVLVHKGQVLARARLGTGEGIAHDPLHAIPGVDADLGRDLVRGVDAQRATVADIRALGALADDDEVDAVRGDARDVERARDTRVELGRAQVDVVVHGETQRKQHPALEHAARHGRVADGTEQDAVVALELLDDARREGLTGAVPAGRAEVVLGRAHLDVSSSRLEDLQALGDHLRSDAVAADDGDVEGGLVSSVGHAPRLGRRLVMWASRLSLRSGQVCRAGRVRAPRPRSRPRGPVASVGARARAGPSCRTSRWPRARRQ